MHPRPPQEPTRPEPVTLVSVERTPGPHGNTFTVNFTKNFPEVFYLAVVGRNKIGNKRALKITII